MDFPLVSILVAARNEEDNILDLLHSLRHLSYPKEHLQILIGNDQSTDGTSNIIYEFIAQQPENERPVYQVFFIEKTVADLRGKANVLVQLAHEAQGEYLLFTDADVEVPVRWVEKMLSYFNDQEAKVGVTIGLTLVKNTNWFEACQAIEWLFVLNLMKNMADFNIPSTGMGNNMMVSAEAYKAVGGYEKIGFSIVEDYALYKAIIDKGYDFRQAFDKEVMTVTKPPPNYFEQRKRWVAGGISTRSILIIPALIQGLALPILLLIAFFSWKIPLLILGANLLINMVLGYSIFGKLHQERLFKYIPVYTLYMYVFWFLQITSYWLPTKLVWKGRSY